MPDLAAMGLASASMSAETDSRGEFSIPGVEPGEYTLTVRHPTRAMPFEFDLVVGESDRDVDLDLPLSIVEGRVTNGAGEPLAGVRVHPERAEKVRPATQAVSVRMVAVRGGSGGELISFSGGPSVPEVETDEEGRFRMRGVQAGVELQVVAEGSNIEPTRSEAFEVAIDEILRNVDLVAEPAGSLLVSAMRPDGSPGRNLLVVASYAGDDRESVEPVTGFMDQTGSTTLSGLSTGLWRVRMQSIGPDSDDDEEIPPQEVEIVAGEEIELAFDV